jgi:hypothetical protein
MINIKVNEKEGIVTSMIISGHADYDSKGKDIVCSAVSGIIFGGLNALVGLVKSKIKIQIETNSIIIKVLIKSKMVDTILKTINYQLATIQQNHAEFVNIITLKEK